MDSDRKFIFIAEEIGRQNNFESVRILNREIGFMIYLI